MTNSTEPLARGVFFLIFLTGTTGLFIMSDESKCVARVLVYSALVIGVLASPFVHQDWVMWQCEKIHPTSTRDAGNCYWNILYGSDIYE